MSDDKLDAIEAQVRRIHYYGDPPAPRLQEDVDGDVEGIMEDVRALLRAAWEERDRLSDIIEGAYCEGWIDCVGYKGHSLAAAWQQSGARRALTKEAPNA